MSVSVQNTLDQTRTSQLGLSGGCSTFDLNITEGVQGVKGQKEYLPNNC